MADERLTDQPAFSEPTIQDSDIFWIEVDNGDGTYSDYKITGADLRTLLVSNIYNNNGTIEEPRLVSVDPSTGSLGFSSDDTAFNFQPSFINWLYNDGTPSNDRQIILSISSIGIYSKMIQYNHKRVYSSELTTISDTPEIIGTYSAIDPTCFTVVAEVSGFCSGTNGAYFKRITQLYRLVAGVATTVGTAEVYEPNGVAFDAVLIPSGQDVQVQVTGISAQVTTWKVVVTVF